MRRRTFRASACNLVEELLFMLDEAHSLCRDTKVNGRSHEGDGGKTCSYCRTIKKAKTFLAKNDKEPSDG